VVIGILIALQVNNWNEEQKERKTEVKYLTSLKIDLETDLINLDSIISQRKRKVSSAMKLLSMDEPKTLVELKRFDRLKEDALGWRSFTPRTNTLDELISSGSLNVIKNDSVKFYLLSNREIIETISIYNEHMRHEYNEFLYGPQSRLGDISPFVDFEATIREKQLIEKQVSQKELIKLTKQTSDFLKNTVVRNGLKLAIRNNSGLSFHSEQLKRDTEKLISFINKDIKK
jgi:hypothetical protein